MAHDGHVAMLVEEQKFVRMRAGPEAQDRARITECRSNFIETFFKEAEDEGHRRDGEEEDESQRQS